MRITALYRNVNGVAILAICTREDWKSCPDHKNCQPVAIVSEITPTMQFDELDVSEIRTIRINND
jgi:hypothetical protein